MAKKKDTLKDLNEFMKSKETKGTAKEKNDFLSKKPTQLVDVEGVKSEIAALQEIPDGALGEEDIAKLIQKIADTQGVAARQILFRVCDKVIESADSKEASDILLQNIVLYLNHQDLLLQRLK